jgi:hypothetical protein
MCKEIRLDITGLKSHHALFIISAHVIYCTVPISTTHGKRQFKFQTLILCNKNTVYRGIRRTLLLDGFLDLADGLYCLNLCLQFTGSLQVDKW